MNEDEHTQAGYGHVMFMNYGYLLGSSRGDHDAEWLVEKSILVMDK
jgi:hypothetical protein